MNQARTIKPENWRTLAQTLRNVIGARPNTEMGQSIDRIHFGMPYAEDVPAIVKRLQEIAGWTYNGNERANALSVLETLGNYGLIERNSDSRIDGFNVEFLGAQPAKSGEDY